MVVRYKSTGDILANNEAPENRQSRKRLLCDSNQEQDSCIVDFNSLYHRSRSKRVGSIVDGPANLKLDEEELQKDDGDDDDDDDSELEAHKPGRRKTRLPLRRGQDKQTDLSPWLELVDFCRYQAIEPASRRPRRLCRSQKPTARLSLSSPSLAASSSAFQIQRQHQETDNGQFVSETADCKRARDLLQPHSVHANVNSNKDQSSLLTQCRLASGTGQCNKHDPVKLVTNNDQRPATSSASSTTASNLMVDLNAAANRLVDTCRLQRHSGSYKVAQAAGSTPTPAGRLAAQLAACSQQRRPGSSGDQHKRVSKFSRPARSPVSLQRHTNARLTRQRLNIQQQRQEQLANLEARDSLQRSSLRAQRSRRQQIQATSRLQTEDQAVANNQRWTNQEAVVEPLGGHTNHLGRPTEALQPTSSSRLARGNVITFNSINMLQTSPDLYDHRSKANSNQQFYQDEYDDDLKTICSSNSSLNSNKPFCKICHLGSSKTGDKLISPCKCSGTMQYIHCGCLLKWLEISNRTNEKPMSCELCAHEYTWHKKFNFNQMQLPKCSFKDLFLHLTFIAAIGLMFFCVLAPIFYKTMQHFDNQQENYIKIDSGTNDNVFRNNGHSSNTAMNSNNYQKHPNTLTNYQKNPNDNRLASSEKFLLLCAALFFVSFFVAIYAQAKARDTLYGLISKFLNMNQTYYITEYDHGQQVNSIENNETNNSYSMTKNQHQYRNYQQQHQEQQAQVQQLYNQNNLQNRDYGDDEDDENILHHNQHQHHHPAHHHSQFGRKSSSSQKS